MAYSDEYKKYVTIDNVRAFYRAKDDTVHLTSTDPDVQAGGFHLSLSKGTQTESTIRELLSEHGVMKQQNLFLPAQEVIKTKDEGSSKSAQVISVTSAYSGTGRSTLAVALGLKLAQEGRRAIVIDMDLRDGALRYLTNQGNSGMLGVFVSDDKSASALRKHITREPGIDCDFLLAPKRPTSSDYLKADFFQEIINTLKTMYDVIILDTAVDRSGFVSYGKFDLDYDEKLFIDFIYSYSDTILYNTEFRKHGFVKALQWLNTLDDAIDEGLSKDILAKTYFVANKIMRDDEIRWELITDRRPVIGALPVETKLISDYSIQGIKKVLEGKSDYAQAVTRLVKKL